MRSRVTVNCRKMPSVMNGGNVDKKQKFQLDRVTAEKDQLQLELSNVRGQMMTLQHEFSSMSAKGSLTDHISSALVLAAKVKHLRQQFPADKSPLDDGIDLCKSTERITKASVKSLPAVLSAESIYRAAMKEISMCKDLDIPSQTSRCVYVTFLLHMYSYTKKELEEMVETRDAARKDLYAVINVCIDEIQNMPLKERAEAVKNTVEFLKQHFDPFFHFVVHDMPSLENLTPAYVEWKETKLAEFAEARKHTDMCRDEVVSAFGSIQSQLSLTDGEDKSQFDLEALLSKYTMMLQKELTITDVEHGRDSGFFAAMLQALEKDLKTEVSNIENLQKLVLEFSQIRTDIEPWLEDRPNIDELQDVRKTLRGLRSKLRHRLADKEDIEENESDVSAMTEITDNIAEIRDEIHQALMKEDQFLCNLSNLADKVFPELITRHPDLGMDVYLAYNGLVKPSHEVDHYELTPVPGASSDLFESTFAGEAIFIREYLLSDGEHLDKTDFLNEVMNYSKITHYSVAIVKDSVATVKAIFFDKSCRHAYVMFSKTGELLSTWIENHQKPSEKIIQEFGFCVAAALCNLHNENIIHGEVTPQNIIIKDDFTSTLLMPDFSRKTVDRCRKKYVSKSGLQFVAPEMCNITDASTMSASGDMYSIGVLFLWLHCPNIQFGTSPEGTLDYKSAALNRPLKDVLSTLLLPSPQHRADREKLLLSEYLNIQFSEETHAETESVSNAIASDGSPSDQCSDETLATNADPEYTDLPQSQSDRHTSETHDYQTESQTPDNQTETQTPDNQTESQTPDNQTESQTSETLVNKVESKTSETLVDQAESETPDDIMTEQRNNDQSYNSKYKENCMSELTIDHWQPEPSSEQTNSSNEPNCKTGQIDWSKIDLSATNLNFPRSAANEEKSFTSQVFDTDISDNKPLVCDKDCQEEQTTDAVSSDLMTECLDKQTSNTTEEECPNLDEVVKGLSIQHSFLKNQAQSPYNFINSVLGKSADTQKSANSDEPL